MSKETMSKETMRTELDLFIATLTDPVVIAKWRRVQTFFCGPRPTTQAR